VTRSLLVVQHQDDCPLGAFSGWLGAAGVPVEIARPYAGEPLPADLGGYSGLLVLGGSAGAYDDVEFPWLPATKALLRDAVAAGLPTLGLCLGHQLLAVACGGRVARNPAGRWMGVFELSLAPAAARDPLFGGFSPGALGARSHQDVVVALPPDATPLASADGVNYAFRVGTNAWGVQFHPEATAAIVAEWATRLGERYRAAGEDRDAELAAAAAEVRAAEAELAASSGRPLALAFATRLGE
jgi:GMP synthase (glutamine-hydrolysing)